MKRVRSAVFALILLSVASAGVAKEFYDSYDEGLKAAKAKNWQVVVQKMSEAISANGTESDRARSYGTNFFKYHPYYYRGVAYFNLGQLDSAMTDLQRATGTGAENLGTIDSYISRIETRLQIQAQQGGNQQPVTPVQPPPIRPPVTNTVPQTQTVAPVNPGNQQDQGLGAARSRAESMLSRASQEMNNARRSKADTRAQEDFSQGQKMLLDARAKAVNASSRNDWGEVANLADRAALSFQTAVSRAQMQPEIAAADVLNDTKARLKHALELYFNGDFRKSSEEFERLTRDQDRNAMLWAFLGASRYYSYLLDGEADASDRIAAENAFRRARQIKPSLRLSSQYFSPRIQKFYETTR